MAWSEMTTYCGAIIYFLILTAFSLFVFGLLVVHYAAQTAAFCSGEFPLGCLRGGQMMLMITIVKKISKNFGGFWPCFHIHKIMQMQTNQT